LAKPYVKERRRKIQRDMDYLHFLHYSVFLLIFVLFVGPRAEYKVGILSDLLKPTKVESVFGTYKPVTMKIHNSDLEIMKCLL
jgi:hypothetical protein